jgi:hypothetical protein
MHYQQARNLERGSKAGRRPPNPTILTDMAEAGLILPALEPTKAPPKAPKPTKKHPNRKPYSKWRLHITYPIGYFPEDNE